MKIPEKINIKTVGIIIFLTVLVTATFVYGQIPVNTFTISSGKYPSRPTLTVWTDANGYFIKDDNGDLIYSNGSASCKATINYALAQVTTGGSILLKKGVYLITETVYYSPSQFIVDKDNVTVYGEGFGNTEIKLANNVCNGTDGASIFRVTSDYVTFHDFAVNANYQNQGAIDPSKDGYNIHMATTAKHFTMYNMKSYYGTGDGVELSGEGAIITGSIFEQNWEHNIHFNGVRDAIASGNLLLNEINNGMISTYASNGDTEHIVISGNIIRGGTEDAIKIGGGINDTRYVLIDGNVIIGSGRRGIYAYKGDVGTTEYITITDNIIKGCGYQGIHIQEGQHIKIEGNQIEFCDRDGIKLEPDGVSLSDIKINDNEITMNNRVNASYSGIALDCGNYDVRRLRIINNDIHCTGNIRYQYGISITAGGAGGFAGSWILENYIPASGYYLGRYQLNQLNNGLGTELQGVNVTAAGLVTFNHGLLGTPDHVFIGWQDAGVDDWFWTATSTTLTINASGGGAYDFNWKAQYES